MTPRVTGASLFHGLEGAVEVLHMEVPVSGVGPSPLRFRVAVLETPFSVAVTAFDIFGNTAVGYAGTVHFTSSDPAATLPADYTFTAADQGVHTFTNGVTLVTAGNQTITATDTVTSSITGKAAVSVVAAAANHLVVSAPANATAGAALGPMF